VKQYYLLIPAVHVLANELYNRVIKDNKERIILVGRCVGAGIALNCLKSLVTFDENKDYFAGSLVKSREDAQAIIAAINKGAFIASVPLLSLERYNAVAVPGSALTALTYTAGSLALMNSGADKILHDVEPDMQPAVGLAGVALASVSGGYLKEFYTKMIAKFIVPLISRFNYDSNHEQPIDRIEVLKGKITAPVLLHFLEKDEVIQWLNDDLRRLCDTFSGKNAYLLTTNDVGHMQMSPEFLSVMNGDFLDNIAQAGSSMQERCELIPEGRPKAQRCTVEGLDEKIHPYGIFSRMWGHHKYALGGIILFCLISLMPELRKQIMPA